LNKINYFVHLLERSFYMTVLYKFKIKSIRIFYFKVVPPLKSKVLKTSNIAKKPFFFKIHLNFDFKFSNLKLKFQHFLVGLKF
jgi:hypothetical protein